MALILCQCRDDSTSGGCGCSGSRRRPGTAFCPIEKGSIHIVDGKDAMVRTLRALRSETELSMNGMRGSTNVKASQEHIYNGEYI
ncbi:hypothetical protein [Sphingomonas sp. Root1294]|uniref:hypothetical protein n=1 Tax=Sphingomonas sp. Root1294 TaxID=1736447 RepID=UPI001F213C25|nr:hypothetical protein [Sphingomonas sp. Root1294]